MQLVAKATVFLQNADTGFFRRGKNKTLTSFAFP